MRPPRQAPAPASPPPAAAPGEAAPASAGKAPGASSAGSVAGALVTGARYWVRLRGRVTGPFDLPALQRQLKQGQISRFHQVSADQTTWKPATDVEGLYGPTVV